MTGLRKAFLVVGASAAVAIMTFIETPFAQNVGGGPAKSFTEPGAASDPTATAAHEKADAAMTVEPNSAPMTDADRKAAAAMGVGSSPVPTR